MKTTLKLPHEFSRENVLEYFDEELSYGYSLVYQLQHIEHDTFVSLPKKSFIHDVRIGSIEDRNDRTKLTIGFFTVPVEWIEYRVMEVGPLDGFEQYFRDYKMFYLGHFPQLDYTFHNNHIFLSEVG
jgi:hypothetical protein